MSEEPGSMIGKAAEHLFSILKHKPVIRYAVVTAAWLAFVPRITAGE